MKRPPLPFWVLAAVCVVHSITALAIDAGREHEGEQAFQLNAVQMQLRLGEAMMLLVPPEERPEQPPDLASIAEDAVDIARAENSPALVKEQAAAIWLIFRPDNAKVSPVELLPDERTPLGEMVALAAEGKAVPPEQRAALLDVDMGDWLRSRFFAYLEADGAMPAEGSAHVEQEREFFTAFATLAGGLMFFGLLGCALILGYPFYKHRVPGHGLRYESISPWVDEWWGGWYGFLFWLALQIVVGTAVSLAVMQADLARSWALMITLAVQIAVGLLTLRFLRLHVSSAAPRSLPGVLSDLQLGLAPFQGRMLPALGWALAGFAIAVPLVYLANWLQLLLPFEQELVTNPILVEVVEAESSGIRLFIMLSAVVAAPFFEEIVFRGVLYRHLRTRIGVRGGVIVSALMFAVVHPSLTTLLPLFALGAVLAVITERSGGILPAMLLHAIWNGQQLLMALLLHGG